MMAAAFHGDEAIEEEDGVVEAEAEAEAVAVASASITAAAAATTSLTTRTTTASTASSTDATHSTTNGTGALSSSSSSRLRPPAPSLSCPIANKEDEGRNEEEEDESLDVDSVTAASIMNMPTTARHCYEKEPLVLPEYNDEYDRHTNVDETGKRRSRGTGRGRGRGRGRNAGGGVGGGGRQGPPSPPCSMHPHRRLDDTHGGREKKDPASAGLIPNGTVLAGSTGLYLRAPDASRRGVGGGGGGIRSLEAGRVRGRTGRSGGGGGIGLGAGVDVDVDVNVDVDETAPLSLGGEESKGGMMGYIAEGLADVPERVSASLTRLYYSFRRQTSRCDYDCDDSDGERNGGRGSGFFSFRMAVGEIRRIDEDDDHDHHHDHDGSNYRHCRGGEGNAGGYHNLCTLNDDPDNYVLISDMAGRWNHLVRRRRRAILFATMLLLWPAGLFSMPRFARSTDSTFRPINGTPSADAVDVFRKAYGTTSEDGGEGGNKSGGGGLGGLSADDPLNPGAFVVLEQIPAGNESDGDSNDEKDVGLGGGDGNGDTITDGKSELYHRARNFALGFEPYLLAHPPFNLQNKKENGKRIKGSANVTAYSSFHSTLSSPAASAPALTVVSYYSLENDNLKNTLGKALISPDGNTAILKVQYAIPPSVSDVGHLKREYVDRILNSIVTYGDEFVPDGVSVKYTGLRFFQRDMTSALQSDLRRMDALVLPLALFILCAVLRRGWRVVVVPIVAIFTTVMGWSTIMYAVCRTGRVQVTQFTPSVMMSLTVGMGIDYTLFLLSRAISELDKCQSRAEADYALVSVSAAQSRHGRRSRARRDAYASIESMIKHAGRTVLVSGATLLCSFLGLTMLPLEMLRSVGIGAAVAIAVSLAVNLTVVPALLHTEVGGWALRGARGEDDGEDDDDVGGLYYYGGRNLRRDGVGGGGSGRTWEGTRKRLADVAEALCCCWSCCCPRGRRCGRRRRRGSDASSSYSSFAENDRAAAAAEEARRHALAEEDRDAYTSFKDLIENGGNDLSAPFLDEDEADRIGICVVESREGSDGGDGGDDDDDGGRRGGGRCVSRNCLLADSGTSDDWDRRTIELEHDGEEGGFVGDLISMQRRRCLRRAAAAAEEAAPGSAASLEPYGIGRHRWRSDAWRRLAATFLLRPWRGAVILVAILALLSPVARRAPELRSSISVRLLLPRSSPSLEAYSDLGRAFGPGMLSPYRIVFDGRNGTGGGKKVDTEEAFELMHYVIREFVKYDEEKRNDTSSLYESDFSESPLRGSLSLPDLRSNVDQATLYHRQLITIDGEIRSRNISTISFGGPSFDLSDAFDESARDKSKVTKYAGIAFVGGFAIPHAAFVAARTCDGLYESDGHCPIEPLHALTALDAAVTSPDRMTTYVTVVLGYDPFGDDGIEWLLAARERLDRMSQDGTMNGYRVVLDGGTGIEYDAVRTVYDATPFMMRVTLVTVFLLVGLFFRSVVAPLRSVLGICITLSFVYGLLVLTYQNGALGCTRIPNFQSTGGEVCWIAPLMAFNVVVGLGLDYDVFLSSRVLEFRVQGKSHASSVAMGLDETAGIITAAGLIMAVAFGGLMLSASPALYQWSFLLTAAVLVDTFLVRTIVVPIIFGFTGQHSWWPRVLPPVTSGGYS